MSAPSLGAVPSAPLGIRHIRVEVTALAKFSVYFRNNKARFKTVQYAYYPPEAKEATIVSRFLLPWQRFRLDAPVGTKVYFLDEDDLRQLESGADLRDTPASITLRLDDRDKIYDIYKMKS